MKKFLAIVGLLTVVATPAFAQGFNPTYGTGNELPSYYDATGHLIQGNATQSAARADSDNAFAMAPGSIDTDSVALTGGGSVGYNQGEEQVIMSH